MPSPALAQNGLFEAFVEAIAHPDGLVADARPPAPLAVAAGAALGLGGAAAFAVVVGLGRSTILGGGGSGDLLSDLLALAAVPPVAALLTLPPLYLVTALRGRAPGLARLFALAASGPAMAGTWLGAGTPLLLLYLLTGGDTGLSFGVLGLLVGLLGVAAGLWSAARTARRAGPQSPGPLVMALHFCFTLWTGLVLALNLL